MPQPIIYIDKSTIREGMVQELRRAIPALVEFIETSEPQLISYGFYVDEETADMVVVAVHPDSASLEFHMDLGGPHFRRFAELIDLRAIEVYGAPSDRALAQLRRKAQMLGEGGRVTVTGLHAGFSRLGQVIPPG